MIGCGVSLVGMDWCGPCYGLDFQADEDLPAGLVVKYTVGVNEVGHDLFTFPGGCILIHEGSEGGLVNHT